MRRGKESRVAVVLLGAWVLACGAPRTMAPPSPDGGPIDAPITPACWVEPERCNGLDDDCDDRVDEGADACTRDHATGTCDAGRCEALACEDGWGDCDGLELNGCELWLSIESACGGCGRACPEGQLCELGRCGVAVGDVAVGASSGVAVGAEGLLFVWSTGERAPQAVRVDGARFVQVAAGDEHLCARSGSGDVYCWGRASTGELGVGVLAGDVDEPTRVALPEPALYLDVADGLGCAVGISGRAYCWGDGTRGQLGDGTFLTQASPTPVVMAAGLERVAVAESHVCGLGEGAVVCWGDGARAQLNLDARASNGVSALAVTRELSCVIVEGEVGCTGTSSSSGSRVWRSTRVLPWPEAQGALDLDVHAAHALLRIGDRLFVSRHVAGAADGPQAELREASATIGVPVGLSTWGTETCVLDDLGRVSCGDLVEAPETVVELGAM